MIRQVEIMIRGACPARGWAVVFSLGLASVAIGLPFFFLAFLLFGMTIVRFVASLPRVAGLSAGLPAQPALRGPPA
jgi:hypothetical protein